MLTNSYLKWYGRVVWIGILANFGMAVPALVAPNDLLRMMGFPEASPAMWPSFSGNLLILLSLFYIPAAMDPARNRMSAYLTLVARTAGVIYFLGFHRDYWLFGVFDLTFLVPQAILLTAGYRGVAGEKFLMARMA